MRFYNIKAKGKFIVPSVSSLPTPNSGENGRLLYDESTDEMYFQTSSGFSKNWTQEFSSGTIMIFGNNSAPVGWTRKADWQDSAMFTFKAAGSISNGGSTDAKAAHTHTGPSHTHTMQSHTHSIGSHTHTTSGHALTTAELPSHTHTYGVQTASASGEYWWSYAFNGTSAATASYSNAPNGNPATSSTGSGNSHSHGNTGGSSGNTGTPSTANTSSAGTGATGSNTAPFYQEVIAATKD